uniref:Kazrin, periplakin interacting protein n=1 Tax=Sus scrofa TaxID=9823 RepID=A0A4X1W932_PIG
MGGFLPELEAPPVSPPLGSQESSQRGVGGLRQPCGPPQLGQCPSHWEGKDKGGGGGSWEARSAGESAPSCGAGAGPARPSGPIACEPGADAAGPSDRPRAGAPSVRADGDCSQPALLREEVSRLQEEVHLLRQMKEMLMKDLEESQGGKSSEVLSATELRVQLAQKEQELARAKEALQAMKADRKRLKGEKTDLVSQMQQLYATLESREEQLRDFIRNYEQHRKESEDAVKALAKEKDLLEREKWELRRQAKEATDHATALRSQLDLKDNRMKELEAELAMAKQSLATLTKDVPKRHSLAMPGETVLNGNQEWVVQADLPLTAAIRQSQQTLYHSHPPHPADRQAVRVSPCHSRQPSVISDASAAEGDRSSTPSDINSPRHRTHSLCNGDSPGPVQKNLHNPIVQSLEDLEDQKRKKKKEKMGFGSISRVFARGKQRKSLDPGLFDGTAPDYYIEEDADW